MALEPGTQLGSYEITGRLGAGGMGEVYRALDTKLEREVAIKTLPAGLAGDADRLARFEREAKLLASLNHAHIASVYGLDEHEGALYIAMELVEGETLEEKLKSGAIPVEEALRLGLQIAEALEAAHEKGVVHRDLKPANVMVTGNGIVKVLDFGLAKAFSGDPNEASPGHSPALSLAMTQQGLVLGTAGYMSPEQASGQATDQRADVWAFGVVLYEMLTGLPLFSGESVPHILADVLRAEPDWDRLPRNLHPRIREALERCLEKKPRKRYAGIADARTDLEVALKDPAGVIVRAADGGSGTAASLPLYRRLLPWAAGVVLAVMLGAVAWTFKPAEPREVIRAVDRLADGQLFMFPGNPVLDITSDGRQFVLNLEDGLSLRSVDSFDAVLVPGMTDQRTAPTFSPDGRSIVSMMGTGATASGIINLGLTRIPVTGGAPRVLGTISDQSDIPIGFSWEADDTILYAKSDGIWGLSANGGMPERLIETQADEQPATPSLLPGGDWMLFSLVKGQPPYNWDTAEIVAESLSTHERRVLYPGASTGRYAPSGHLVLAIGNTLYAMPFDVKTLEVSGGPIPVVPGVQRAAGNGYAQYRFSNNGTLIYVPGDAVSGAATASLAIIGENGTNAGTYPMPAGTYNDPRVSPDGRWVAYTTTYSDGDDITVYDLGGGSAPRRLTFGGQSRYPAWSADSTRVAFQSIRDGTPSLYWQLADGSVGDPVRLTTAEEGEQHIPDSFSPDGKWLAFTVTTEADSSVWTVNLADGEAEPLIEGPGAVSQAVFSPNGRWIAYQAVTGNSEVFVQPFPLTGARFQLPEAADNHHPSWAADGSKLYFFVRPGVTASVEVNTEGTFGFGAVQDIYSLPMNAAPGIHRQYDVMPDGSGFLGVFAEGDVAEGSASEARIVYNWFDELERLVPTD